MDTLIFGPGTAKSMLKPLRRAYVFFGEDDHQKREALALLRAATVDESFAEFDCETLDAATTPVENLLAAAGLVPFGSERRLVIVKGAELFRKRDKQADAERLADGIGRAGDCCCLALLVAADEDEKGRGKTVVSAKFDKVVGDHAVAVRCRGLSEDDLADWVVGAAQAAGKRLQPAAARRLVAVSRGDRTVLTNELEKAIAYVGENDTVTQAAVEATASYDPEDVMFKLVDAICQKNADRALTLLHELLRYDNKPQSVAGRLLALLARQMRMLWQARELSARGVEAGGVRSLPPDLQADLPGEASIVSMAWKARDIFAQSRRWKRASLTRAFEMLLECDMANKGGGEGSEDVVTNVELLVMGLCVLP